MIDLAGWEVVNRNSPAFLVCSFVVGAAGSWVRSLSLVGWVSCSSNRGISSSSRVLTFWWKVVDFWGKKIDDFPTNDT